jgi:hypothetical protein
MPQKSLLSMLRYWPQYGKISGFADLLPIAERFHIRACNCCRPGITIPCNCWALYITKACNWCILNLHKKLVLVTYSMSYYDMVSVVPFLVIITVFALARTADQIWWCPFQIPHFVGFRIFWHINQHMWSKELGHLPIICIIWIYYLTIDPNDVQITWWTP